MLNIVLAIIATSCAWCLVLLWSLGRNDLKWQDRFMRSERFGRAFRP